MGSVNVTPATLETTATVPRRRPAASPMMDGCAAAEEAASVDAVSAANPELLETPVRNVPPVQTPVEPRENASSVDSSTQDDSPTIRPARDSVRTRSSPWKRSKVTIQTLFCVSIRRKTTV